MTRLWKKASEVTVTKRLILGKGATLELVNDSGRAIPNTPRIEALSASTALTKEQSGTTFILGANGAALITLPDKQQGLYFNFIQGDSTSGTQTIGSGNSDNELIGGITELEVDTGSDGPSTVGADAVLLVGGTSVAGDFVEFWCDGSNWYFRGQTAADGGATIS